MTDLTYQDEVVGTIRPSTHEDCLVVGHNLRDQDKLELWNYSHEFSVEGVTNSFNLSEVAMTIEKDGVPIAMFGIQVLNGIPTLWLFGTDALNIISRIFVRNTREWIGRMLIDYPTLVAYCDVRNRASERWLRFVGGKQIDTMFMGKDDMPFRKFIFQRKELTVRNTIMDIQHRIEKMPDALWGDAHLKSVKFSDGLYIRECHLPTGFVIVTKLFKQSHATFMLLGECSVLTEKGVMRVKAPFHMVTPVGTKRVIYVHETAVWITVHPNPKNLTDPKLLEEDIIAKDYGELDKLTEKESKFIEEVLEVK